MAQLVESAQLTSTANNVYSPKGLCRVRLKVHRRQKGPASSQVQLGELDPDVRKAAQLRNEMIAVGFTDKTGAIHSAERILNILGLRLNYPELSHINNLRGYRGAEFSIRALAAHRAGDTVLIEHVAYSGLHPYGHR